ncbi:uncharacterized protein LOC126906890 [Daktulosphaira vitifoliae]|uniref:uncharacterized protein LOC126906890 n=1 Tax=Daktulosphaira vitifoliae TaxID=58002 RepID=UPI0021A99249|nr:uncharacterized protein LOC126906890 [Daktulosphaira vitifoliae]
MVLTLPKIYLFIVYIILLIKAERNLRKKTNIFISLLRNPGWKNLHDVQKVIYRQDEYLLEKTFELSDLNITNCNSRVRIALVILSCSYAKDLRMIFFVFQQYCDYCENLTDKEDNEPIKYHCIINLVKLIKRIKIIAKLIGGSLFMMNILHLRPSKKVQDNDFFINNLLLKLSKVQKTLDDIHGSIDEPLKNLRTLVIIDAFAKDIYRNINAYIDTFCCLASCDLDLLWEDWNNEYKKINEKIEELQFHDFLNVKLYMTMKSISSEKYFKLGFNYNSNTRTMFIPTKHQSAEIACFGLKFEVESRGTKELIDFFKPDMFYKIKTEEIPEFINLIEKEIENQSKNKKLSEINFVDNQELNLPVSSK